MNAKHLTFLCCMLAALSQPIVSAQAASDTASAPPAGANAGTSHQIANSEVVTEQIAIDIATKASAAGLDSISILRFLHNGGLSNNLTSHVQSMLTEQLSMNNPNEIAYFDRQDSKLVATESGLSLGGEELSASQAILTGEVFSEPGDSIGFICYRLFRANDTKVIAAGFSKVQWSRDESRMHGSKGQRISTNSLPISTEQELDALAGKLQQRIKTGLAFGQTGNLSKDNTREIRIAYAQIIPILLQKGINLFEREYFKEAAIESSLSNHEVMPGQGVGAVGALTPSTGSGETTNFKIQINAIPKGNLILSATFKQQKSGRAIANNKPQSAENALDSFLNNLEATAQGDEPQLIFEYEHVIEDELKRWIYSCIPDIYNKCKGDRKQIMRELNSLATIGQCNGNYGFSERGAWKQCMSMVNQEILCKPPKNLSLRSIWGMLGLSFENAWKKSPNQGRVKVKCDYSFDFEFVYEVDITPDENGVPKYVKIKLDFTPSKEYIVRRDKNNPEHQ